MRKRRFALLLAAVSLLCLTACGKTDTEAGGTGDATVEEGTQSTENVSDASLLEETDPEETPDNTPEPYVQPEMKGEITITLYQTPEWLEMAVELFENKYPDMTVTIESFFDGADTYIIEGDSTWTTERPAGQTREDYVAWLNTHLITGDVGDIISTSEGLAVGKYGSMGVFEDLTPYLASATEINEEGYHMNIFDAYRTQSGALYIFPLAAMPSPLITFNKEIVDETGLLPETEGKSMTWREALTLAEKMYDASALPGKRFTDPQSILWNVFTKEVIASVDYENGQIALREKEMLEVLNAFEEFEQYDIFQFDPNNPSFEVFTLPYINDTMAAREITLGNYAAVQWKQSDGKVHLSPYFTYDFGVNSRSENKALAWEFLKFLLSDEIQTLPAFPYAGINKNGLQTRINTYCQERDIPAEEAEEMLRMINGWISQIDGYRPEDTDLIQIGDAIMAEFLRGNLTPQEAVDEAAFRLEQYLSE